MRPTPIESLRCMQRVLAEIIMPAVQDDYAAEQLGHQLVALDDLSRHVLDTIPSLMRANDELLAIVCDARGLVADTGIEAQLETLLATASAPPPPYPDFDDLCARNNVLREAAGLLIRVLPGGSGLTDGQRAIRSRIRAHLDRSIERAC